MTKTLTMRELNGGDLFTMIGILGKLDIKEDLVELIERQYGTPTMPDLNDHKAKKLTKSEQEEKDKAIEKRGMKVAVDIGFSILRHVGDAKQDINNFLADLTGKTAADIEKLSMFEYTNLLVSFAKKPELKDFFQSISSLLA